MTVAEEFSPSTPRKGSTQPTNYADALTNVVDLFARAGYIPETSASSPRNIDYISINISEPVKMWSEDRPKMVPVDRVARGASGIVGVLCIASLILGSISKFQMVHPFVAVVFLAAAIFFYGTTTFASRK